MRCRKQLRLNLTFFISAKIGVKSLLVSLNIVDKVVVHLKHLQQTNSVARDKDAQLLFFRSLIIL